MAGNKVEGRPSPLRFDAIAPEPQAEGPRVAGGRSRVEGKASFQSCLGRNSRPPPVAQSCTLLYRRVALCQATMARPA